MERLNTSRTVVKFQRKKHSAPDSALWQNQTKHIQKRNGGRERIDAVNRYQRSERPSRICKSPGRSRSWLQKWVGRYNSFNRSSEKEWFKEESRTPKNVHRRTDSEMEQLVVNVRNSLMEGKTDDTNYRCIWADEMQFRMYLKVGNYILTQ